ncbi:hypothetical protein D3C72_2107210 [compost metagenome]
MGQAAAWTVLPDEADADAGAEQGLQLLAMRAHAELPHANMMQRQAMVDDDAHAVPAL